MHQLSFSKKISRFIATGFGSGLSPKAPGTCGTIAILIISLLILLLSGPPSLITRILFAFIASITSIISSSIILNAYSEDVRKDPQEIVMDEFAGYLTTVMFVPWSPLSLLLGFILFRIFDITKPGPVKSLENLPGSYGILFDDIGAGILAGICLTVIMYFFI